MLIFGSFFGLWQMYRTMFGIATFFIFAAELIITALAIIGLVTVIKWIAKSKDKSKEMDPHEKWLKTGKM